MTVRSKRCTQVLAVMLALSMVVGVFLKLEARPGGRRYGDRHGQRLERALGPGTSYSRLGVLGKGLDRHCDGGPRAAGPSSPTTAGPAMSAANT